MKHLLYLLLFISQIGFAKNGFNDANELYRKGQYQQATTIYEQILSSKKHSAELYFNLGNCYYKMKKVAPAIYNYEKALLLNPNDKSIKTNLKFAQKMRIDDIKEVPNVGFNRVILDFTSAFHYNTWAWLAVGFSILFLCCFLGYYFSSTTLLKRLFFGLMFLCLIAIVSSSGAGIIERNNYQNDHPAIVFVDIVAVKTEPKTESQDAFVLHEGTKVQILEKLDNWCKIVLSNDTEGWIEKSYIKEIK
ncbi:MAG: tetratricopeptide repeat protein [Flavobacterium sp.]